MFQLRLLPQTAVLKMHFSPFEAVFIKIRGVKSLTIEIFTTGKISITLRDLLLTRTISPASEEVLKR